MNILDGSIAELASELLEAGAFLEVDPRNRLKVIAPSGVVSNELDRRIRATKKELALFVRLSHCARCGSIEFRDSPIHGGNSTRRDCARCGRFIGFLRWNPQE